MQKNTIFALIMLVLGLAAIYLFLPRIISPKIEVETAEYDFGNIPQQKVSHVLRIKNSGKQPLEITRVSTSCGCTTASIDKTSLPAGGSANLTITFDPNLMGEVGPVEKVVYIRSNDPANEEASITVKMNVVPGLQSSPIPSVSPTATLTAFGCPKEKYIDCMPGPDMPPEKQKLCSGDYHEWIKNNCLNIQFAY